MNLDLAHHQERLAVVRGPERLAEVRIIGRALLDRIERADITHEEAGAAVRAMLVGLEGGQ